MASTGSKSQQKHKRLKVHDDGQVTIQWDGQGVGPTGKGGPEGRVVKGIELEEFHATKLRSLKDTERCILVECRHV